MSLDSYVQVLLSSVSPLSIESKGVSLQIPLLLGSFLFEEASQVTNIQRLTREISSQGVCFPKATTKRSKRALVRHQLWLRQRDNYFPRSFDQHQHQHSNCREFQPLPGFFRICPVIALLLSCNIEYYTKVIYRIIVKSIGLNGSYQVIFPSVELSNTQRELQEAFL